MGRARSGSWVSDSGFAWLPVVMIFALFLYMCVPENVLEGRPPLTAMEMLTAAPNPFYRILKYALLVLGLGVVTWRFALARWVLGKLNIFYLAFLVLVALSLSWSIAAPDTFLRLAALVTIGLVSFSFSLLGWRPDRLTTVIRLTLTLFLFVSLICCAVRPDIAKELGEGVSWRRRGAESSVQRMCSENRRRSAPPSGPTPG